MYDRLKGIVLEKHKGYTIIEAPSGWCYKVFTPLRYLEAEDIIEGNAVILFVVVIKKETEDIVYGFLLHQERDTFSILCKVHGVGAKTSLQIIGVLTVCGLHRAVLADDIKQLQKVPGVGGKIAKRILFELKPKFVDEKGSGDAFVKRDPGVVEFSQEAYNVMVHLGYSSKAAKIAVTRAVERFGNDMSIEDLVSISIKEATRAIQGIN